MSVVVLGIGNILLTDDGIGVRVVEALEQAGPQGSLRDARLRDGGTIGLALLSEIDPDGVLVAVDAMEMGEAPGTVRVFEGAAMDLALSGIKRTAHEVALSDLMMAAELSGAAPDRRALVAIQPDSTGWGLELTPNVAAAVPVAARAVETVVARWTREIAAATLSAAIETGRETAGHV